VEKVKEKEKGREGKEEGREERKKEKRKKGKKEKEKGREGKEEGREERKKEEKERKKEEKEGKRKGKQVRGRRPKKVGSHPRFFFILLIQNEHFQGTPSGKPLSGHNPLTEGGCHKTPLVGLERRLEARECPPLKKTRFF
jgi:hypothetical protein